MASINILLQRENLPYEEAGRYQTEAEAKEIDKEMHFFMESQLQSNYEIFPVKDYNKILRFIIESPTD